MFSRLIRRSLSHRRVQNLCTKLNSNGQMTLGCFYSVNSTNNQKNRVGIALCGFGRAGKIHFHGIRQNHRCNLKYVVDAVESMSSIQECLERYNLSDTAKAISTEDFENVLSLRFNFLAE